MPGVEPVAPAGGAAAGRRGPGRWPTARPFVSLGIRLVLAGVALWAGIAKVGDLEASVRAVRAYQLLPDGLAVAVGYGLPVVEIILGLLLLVGLLTRPAAILNGILMLAFVAGVVSAWVRGLSIDCGCFGGGGVVEPEDTEYLTVLLRDAALLAASVLLASWPRSRLSADRALGLV